MNNILTRQLLSTDDPSSAEVLLQKFFTEEGFETPAEVITRNLQTMLGLDICAVIIAETGNDLIGIATVSMDFGIEYGWSAELGDLYVLPEWRGRGVSRLLVRTVEDYLRSKGAAGYQVTLTTHASEHHDLKSYYLSLGFESEGRNLLYRTLR
jgi:GNAT superfamily N-acetyltransferase